MKAFLVAVLFMCLRAVGPAVADARFHSTSSAQILVIAFRFTQFPHSQVAKQLGLANSLILAMASSRRLAMDEPRNAPMIKPSALPAMKMMTW